MMPKKEDEVRDRELEEGGEDPYIYINGKKEMKDGSGMVKESYVVAGVDWAREEEGEKCSEKS